ncbi:Hypothetical_protein [Hexamita inflata]|uniref:Hypothetical_protein n=1 Tax=Hexamita inflata TaxID=28002 RepID=A0AA86QII3_9EUKA|nr:Hypothetical protein HINF_LOCUS46985 [Hexamita inflata]
MSCYFNDDFYILYSNCNNACTGLCIGSTWGYCCKPKGSLWWLGPLFGGITGVVLILVAGYIQFRKKQRLTQERTTVQIQQNKMDTALAMQVYQQSPIMMYNTQENVDNSNTTIIHNNLQNNQNSINFTAVM